LNWLLQNCNNQQAATKNSKDSNWQCKKQQQPSSGVKNSDSDQQ